MRYFDLFSKILNALLLDRATFALGGLPTFEQLLVYLLSTDKAMALHSRDSVIKPIRNFLDVPPFFNEGKVLETMRKS